MARTKLKTKYQRDIPDMNVTDQTSLIIKSDIFVANNPELFKDDKSFTSYLDFDMKMLYADEYVIVGYSTNHELDNYRWTEVTNYGRILYAHFHIARQLLANEELRKPGYRMTDGMIKDINKLNVKSIRNKVEDCQRRMGNLFRNELTANIDSFIKELAESRDKLAKKTKKISTLKMEEMKLRDKLTASEDELISLKIEHSKTIKENNALKKFIISSITNDKLST